MVLTSNIPRSKSSLDTIPKFYLIEIPRRVAFTDLDCPLHMDHEDDNPFRPGSELSREAEIIVNLIKEGKPITPTGDTSANNNNNNNNNEKSQILNQENELSMVDGGENISKRTQQQLQQTPSKMIVNNNIKSNKKSNDNSVPTTTTTTSSSSPSSITNNGQIIEPGNQVEVQHGIIISSNSEQMPMVVEQVNIKKKRKCCSIQ